MTNEINDGGPAFAASYDEYDSDNERWRVVSTGGMTLRDYFAAKVMQGVLANLDAYKATTDAELAKKCYLMADAMLKARGQ